MYKHLKLLWDGFSRTWWSETAHDWRVIDSQFASGDGNQDYYDKPINIFRAYLETVIAALSVIVPPVKCFPDDADNPLDLLTAKAGDKIGQLIDRHNDSQITWVQGLFIYVTEGMVANYTYAKEDKAYGVYKTESYEEVNETHNRVLCSICQYELADTVTNEQEREDFAPEEEDAVFNASIDAGMEMCPNCGQMMKPETVTNTAPITRLTGTTLNPKSRVCNEVYGGLYVKIPNYAKKQSDCPYLILSYETNYAQARARFPDYRDKIQPNDNADNNPYERWGRQNVAYHGESPQNNVTIRTTWLRPDAYQVLSEIAEVNTLKKKYPDGARVTMVNDCIVECENENLDDCWTLTYNPLSDYLTFDPLGMMLISVQEITNDLVSLTQQTIEHGIPQTFVDENTLDFKAYQQLEATPGAIFPAKARAGKSIGDSFYEVKTASLSQEVLPFINQIQSFGQLEVGALPSLFGGDIAGSKTASQYSMSRAQALQRLQNTWKMFTAWRKQVMGKSINLYIKEMKDDEQFVEIDDKGNFINTFIKKSELEGKIGNIELEANENLPITWSQRKDLIMQLVEANNPQIFALLSDAENLPLFYEAIGIPDFNIPGLDSRNKQYEEIKHLVSTEPLQQPPDPVATQQAIMSGMPPPPPQEISSVQVEEFDNHQVELDTCIQWINNPTGQLAKQENPPGYMNVVLHAKEHKNMMMMQAMEQQQQMMMMQGGVPPPGGEAPLPNAEPNLEAPIQGEGDVAVN